MKRLTSLFVLVIATLASLSAVAGHLDGVVPLARDELAAVTQIRATPARHAMLYFGDHLN